MIGRAARCNRVSMRDSTISIGHADDLDTRRVRPHDALRMASRAARVHEVEIVGTFDAKRRRITCAQALANGSSPSNAAQPGSNALIPRNPRLLAELGVENHSLGIRVLDQVTKLCAHIAMVDVHMDQAGLDSGKQGRIGGPIAR